MSLASVQGARCTSVNQQPAILVVDMMHWPVGPVMVRVGMVSVTVSVTVSIMVLFTAGTFKTFTCH